jgi:hypothetical protein
MTDHAPVRRNVATRIVLSLAFFAVGCLISGILFLISIVRFSGPPNDVNGAFVGLVDRGFFVAALWFCHVVILLLMSGRLRRLSDGQLALGSSLSACLTLAVLSIGASIAQNGLWRLTMLWTIGVAVAAVFVPTAIVFEVISTMSRGGRSGHVLPDR